MTNMANMENSNFSKVPNKFEYINLENFDYEYTVEEFLLDINNFIYKEEDTNVKDEKAKKKNLNGNKEKDASTKIKKGKNKKKEVEDLNLTKQSSKMSIYSTKITKDSKKIKNILGQKLKVGTSDMKILKNMNMSVLLDKNKLAVEILTQKNIPSSSATATISAIEEEVVTTTKPQIEDDKKKSNKKNKKDKGKNKPKDEEKKVTKEKEDKTSQQNKRVEDFLKSVKDKKQAGRDTKIEQKLLIKTLFLDKHKYLFTIDPTQRLRLRDLATINKEVINSFFDQLNMIYNSFEKFIKDEEYVKTNVKDAMVIIDNLCEICLSINNLDLLKITLEKSIEFSLYQLDDINSSDFQKNPFIKTTILNILYTAYKYHLETSSLSIKDELIISLYNNLSKLFKEYIKNNKNLNLKEDNEAIFQNLTKTIICLILSMKNSDKKYDINILIDENMKNLLLVMEKGIKTENTEFDYDIFIIEYNNLRFFTKFSYLFDFMKNKIYSLSIKTSRSLDSNLTELQNILIKNHEKLFANIINKILLKYIHNFDVFYEINENLYDDLFNLMKYLCDGKLFSGDNIEEIFYINGFISNELKLEDFSLPTDEMYTKYITLIIKYIKYFEKIFASEFQCSNNYINIFLFYYHQVLSYILNLKQSYIREKYIKIMEKTIEPRLDNNYISAQIFKYITEFIKNNLLTNLNINLIKNIKILKDLTKFYSGYQQVKQNILAIFDNEIKNEIEFSLFTIFFVNFLDLNKAEDKKLLYSLTQKSGNFIENILFLDKKLCSYLMKYYINEEINSIDKITEIIFEDLCSTGNKFLLDNLIKFLLKNLEDNFVSNFDINNINIVLQILEKFLSKKLIDVDKLQELVFQIINIRKKSKPISTHACLALDTTLINFINKLSSLMGDDEQGLSKFVNLISSIKQELSFNFQFDIVKEISLINDKLKRITPKDYLNSINQLLLYVLELIKLDKLLKCNPNYFKVDNPIVENMSINEGEGEEKKNEITIHNDKINLDIILHLFKNYFNLIFSLLKEDKQTPIVLYNIETFQHTIFLILSNNTIFNNLTGNVELLKEFIKMYFSIKEYSFDFNQRSMKELRKVENDDNRNVFSKEKSTISQHLSIMEYTEKIGFNLGNFVKYRCKDQIVYLFKEPDIYKMLLTKDREFHHIIFEQINNCYTTTILNEENVKSLIAKAQNEEEDLLEEVVYSIFSKQVIKYLECPEEIIEFLATMNDALKFDLKVDRKEFYNSLFSYFYIWKMIMSKIENGFKLYTTDKQYVSTIDNYKTLLKFVISYLERNGKLYEMFLLLVVSLIHIIDDDKMLDNKSINFKLNNFDDTLLTNEFDTNTFQFLLSVLYKFVKIFPSLVKFYYDESKTKLKNVFKNLNNSIILPNMLIDLKEKINLNSSLLSKYQIKIRETKSLNYIEFDFNANDEIKFLIEIKIPPVFPLKKLDIAFKCNAVIDERKLLNVKMNLNQTMNSSIDNATDNLIIWAENVRELIIKGNDPCPVCYSYLHGTDKSLPNLSCRTCKKKFHSLCIKEWFKNLSQNQQKSSCPMCRSEWKMH